ncbi:MAG: cytochrome c oxidase assembly protein [candidate division Zixibacteria bacterium]|nr:cytochrome c oxidase assembly protein [candidate division Zixibacteria bacterium]
MSKNKKLGLAFGAFGILMFGFAFANVPAFKMFCRKLGFGLSPNNTEAKVSGAALASNREVEVLFMGVVAGGAPIVFEAVEATKEVRLGQQTETAYRFVNLSKDTIRFRPVHSILPEGAATRFSLKKCFCFEDQTLLPRQEVAMPVVFSIAPDLDSNVERVTLNYTLFQKPLHEEK